MQRIIFHDVKKGEDLLQGHIGELASGYEFIYKQLQTVNLYDPKREDIGKWLEHLATVAPKVARLYKYWEGEPKWGQCNNGIWDDGFCYSHHPTKHKKPIPWWKRIKLQSPVKWGE